MDNNLKISVVTVCFNVVKDIERTMLSVLHQTYSNIEYIVIDGGSTDGTVDIIRKYTDRLAYWISEPDNGIYDAMNKGIAVATGDYINFMNAGDTFVNDNVVIKIVAKFKPENTVVYGDTLQKRQRGTVLAKALNQQELTHRGAFCHQSAFTLLSYHKQNPFDLKYKVLADFNFFFQAYNSDNQQFEKLDFPVSIFDMTDGGLSKAHYERNYEELRKIICKKVSPIYMIWLHVREKLGILKRHIIK